MTPRARATAAEIAAVRKATDPMRHLTPIAAPKPNKYGAQKTEVDGIVFHSRAEARHWAELKLRERAGEISGLERQVAIPLWASRGHPLAATKPPHGAAVRFPNGRHAVYIADFAYIEDGTPVMVDVKGMDTPLSRLKRAIVEAMTGRPVLVVGRRKARAA